jgi:hypothetical protein
LTAGTLFRNQVSLASLGRFVNSLRLLGANFFPFAEVLIVFKISYSMKTRINPNGCAKLSGFRALQEIDAMNVTKIGDAQTWKEDARSPFFRLAGFPMCLLAFWVVIGLVVLQPTGLVHAASGSQLRVLQSDTSRVVLELEVSGYDVREQNVGGATYAVLSIPELGYTSEPGKPQLPIRGALVGIPPGGQASLKIVADETRTDSLAHPPVPAPRMQVQINPSQTLPQESGVVFAPDAASYSSNQQYPGEVARITSSGNWRSQWYVTVEFHPLQYNGATRRLIFHHLVRVEVTFSYAGGKTPQALGGMVSEGSFEPVLQQAVVNYASAKSWRMKNAPAKLPASRGPAVYTSGSWYKVAVNADGIYQITCAQLQSAGINLGSLNPNTLKVYKQGTELAINVVGQTWGTCDSSDYIEFFGQAARTKYTDTNIYWLTYGGVAGKRMGSRNGSGAGAVPRTFTDNVHLEQDLKYRSYVPTVEGADHWFWNWLPNGVTYADYPFQLLNPASGDLTATLQMSVVGYNEGSHRTQVYVNGNLVDDTSWSGQVERRATFTFPQTYLNTGTNTIRVSEVGPSGDCIFVNYFDMGYARLFTATNDALRFRYGANGTWRYRIGGFTGSSVETFDITDPFNVTRIVSPTITQTGSSYTLEFGDLISVPREYVALESAQRQAPLSITRDSPSDLHNPANGADYIIISYGGFIPNLQPLINLRNTQFPRQVKVVDVQDVYDEFSDGLMDAQALRDFLAYAYVNWQAPAPSFVLLVGDGNFDFKNHLGTGEANFVPPYLRMVDPWMGETASDNRLVAFNDSTGNTLPSMAIGRLPAASAADVDAMVAKLVNYEQSPVGGNWQTRVAFVADDPDSAGDFWAYSDSIASDPLYLPAPYSADRIYYDVSPYTTVSSERSAIISSINDGRLILNYVGHGSIGLWAAEQFFTVNDVNALANGSKLPVMLSLSCLVGYFQYPGFPGLGESIVRFAGGGVLASWAGSGEGMADGQDLLDRGFFDAVMQHGVRQLGPATMLGKMNLWLNSEGTYLDLVDTFNLLGDPASRLTGSSAIAASTPTATWTPTITSTSTPTPTNTPVSLIKPSIIFLPIIKAGR